ncbi:MAG: PspA/IM30 family protein [Corynebacterium sp.]|uniref:PspA/IM30 family protein n=1 Tax=Corynebacterium sp. TaxID=1720 RepID=UPI0026DD9807|nr:PspA/IM30 family protein [Corynebacterium sp.]MDO4762301.1 PspA/IM30 family protein [Corynebacterium sp.]
MANPLSKGWKYLTTALDAKIDENADPQVQIQQAVNAAKQAHQEIAKQAAAVIGNKNQLEMKLNRLIQDQQKLQENARQAITLADQAQAAGDSEKVGTFTQTAEVYATQLVSVEEELENTKALHQQAVQNAEAAKVQLQQSEARLTQQLAEAEQLMRQAQQAKMQESATKAMDHMAEFTVDDNVPTLDSVRAKIESRYANALGAQELMEGSMGERMAEIDAAGTDMKANARLDEIRAQMASETKQLEEDKRQQALEAADEVLAEANAEQEAAAESDADAPAQAESQETNESKES